MRSVQAAETCGMRASWNRMNAARRLPNDRKGRVVATAGTSSVAQSWARTGDISAVVGAGTSDFRISVVMMMRVCFNAGRGRAASAGGRAQPSTSSTEGTTRSP